MKLCEKHGNGVCINCPRTGFGGMCRYKANEMLDILISLLRTKLTDEQITILADYDDVFEIMFYREE